MTSLATRQAGEPRLRRPRLRRPRLRRPEPRRNRWLWAGVAAAAFGTLVAALTVGLGGSATGPAVGNLKLAQLQVGDCLTGADMDLNTSNPWPKLTSAVPCRQPHTAEVFFADNTFWPKSISFPGSVAIAKDGNAACNSAFRSYVGIAFPASMFNWTNIIPDASTWPSGDRGLHCIAYYSTHGQPAGATITGSIRGARK